MDRLLFDKEIKNQKQPFSLQGKKFIAHSSKLSSRKHFFLDFAFLIFCLLVHPAGLTAFFPPSQAGNKKSKANFQSASKKVYCSLKQA
jgi:hypothetical protein